VLHGHFYQPPREDPWTDLIPVELSAAPDPNWNVRITRECYGPLARAGAFEWMSFDFGPTLLRWLAAEAPEIHEAVVAADAASVRRLGNGNAIAQPYHHVILPLASAREKRTEVSWGIRDFERRFGRRPEGMWLPETAVDLETLDVLAAAGIAFTIVSPHQIETPPADGRAGRVDLEGGRSIAVFTYDGALSHGVAFGELLRDADAWRRTLLEHREPTRRVLSIATDGETFGHHHAGADGTLLEVLSAVEASDTHRLDNFASSLARHGVSGTVELVEPSSWSCSHGVDRWQRDCGCKMAPHVTSQQTWREPLRSSLGWLAAELDPFAGSEAVVLAEGPETHGLARDRGAMFTSCGWFFDDVAGLEPTQLLRYAAHAIDVVAASDPGVASRLESELIERLSAAKSNDRDVGDAGRLYVDAIRAEHPFGGQA
jgi:alpha-amylase/alpha-mannosidase (GH57 family)